MATSIAPPATTAPTPSSLHGRKRDNRQTLALQGHTGTLTDCRVCHGVTPAGPGPHGLYPSGITEPDPALAGVVQMAAWPNPASGPTQIRYRIVDPAGTRLSVVDAAGREVRVLTSRSQTAGDHTLVWNGRDGAGRPSPAGVYFARLENGGSVVTARMVRLR